MEMDASKAIMKMPNRRYILCVKVVLSMTVPTPLSISRHVTPPIYTLRDANSGHSYPYCTETHLVFAPTKPIALFGIGKSSL